MKLPAWLRERIHEFATPGGCWISARLIGAFERSGVTDAGEIGVGGAAAMVLASRAAKAGPT